MEARGSKVKPAYSDLVKLMGSRVNVFVIYYFLMFKDMNTHTQIAASIVILARSTQR